jgi:hypothetical protein
MKKLIFLNLFIFALFFQQCKKADDTFTYCTGCPLSSWEGYYVGTANFYTANTGETFENVDVTINIDNTYDSTLVINVNAPDYISENFSASKKDDNYYLLIGAGSRILDIGLKKKDNELKLDGTLKINSWSKIDSTWSVNKSLTFEAFKK